MGQWGRIGTVSFNGVPLCTKRWIHVNPRYFWPDLGKMKLYEHHVGFSSQFNPKTLFGFTDIRIPKWDIYQIVLGKHLLSVKITLETTHGNIEFTNFMTMEDPY